MLLPRHTVSQGRVRLSAACPVRSDIHVVDGRSIEPHDHEYFEVFLVLRGSARHVTNDYARSATRGTVGIVAPGEVHGFLECHDLHVTNVYYLAEWLLQDISGSADWDHLRSLFLEPALFAPSSGRAIPQIDVREKELQSVTHDLSDLNREAESGAPSIVYLRASLLKCMVVIARAYAGFGRDPVVRLRDEAWAVMQECEKAVAAGRTPSIGPVASRFSITEDHLRRVFRACTGTSPSGYFTRRRVFAAAARLLDPSASVTGVAVDLGFSDTAHLSRHFRRELGVSPRDYRRRYQVTGSASTMAPAP